MSCIFQDLEVQLKGTQQEIPGSKGIVKKVEEDLSIVKERNTLQEKEILQKAGKMLINVTLKYFPCQYSLTLEIPQVIYAI